MKDGRRVKKPWLAELNRKRAVHGMWQTRTFGVWSGMLERCRPGNKDSHRYYERGIRVCERWMDFRNFYADMGEKPEGMSLDRIDNDGNYEPGNCRWATPTQQASNKRNSRLVTFRGRTQTVAQWARELGTSRQTLRHRLEAGWRVEDAVTVAPVRGRNEYR